MAVLRMILNAFCMMALLFGIAILSLFLVILMQVFS